MPKDALRFLDNAVRLLRKKGVGVMLVSQKISDFDPEDVIGRSRVSVDDVSRMAKDFLAFVQRSGLSSAYLDHTLEETLKDIESPVGLPSKRE